MRENDWNQSICDKLNIYFANKSLKANTLQKIPYSQEIIRYTESWEPEYMEPISFETDMIIYEEAVDRIIPRVIIEAKIGTINTHDAITYSYKAEKHKNITPYLRYGIMIGDRKHYPLPGRLYRHGSNFDFMFSFVGTIPKDYEWKSFTDMLLKEVEYSRITEEMLHENRNKDRKHYYMLQKQLVVSEMPDV